MRMVETIRDRYNKILTGVQKICNNYVKEKNSPQVRNRLEIDIKRLLENYKSMRYIDAFNVDCGNSYNSPSIIKRGEISFMFTVELDGKKEGARHTFRASKAF